MSKSWRYIIFIIILVNLTVWLAVLQLSQRKLRLIACDVGQGDAILATYGKVQFLIDGGPDAKVLDCLSKYMPFFDRKIEVVVLTHPEKDHFGGLVDVFERYQVEYFVANALESSSQSYKVLKDQVRGRNIRVINPKKDLRIGYNLMHLDILFPTEEHLALKIKDFDTGKNKNVLGVYTGISDLNQYSIVTVFSFKEFNALMTGDMTSDVSEYLVENIFKSWQGNSIEYIKIPHHGSRNNLTENLISEIKPKVAVISAGEGNPYGHPHQEILDLLKSAGVKILRTDEMGDVVIKTDGYNFSI